MGLISYQATWSPDGICAPIYGLPGISSVIATCKDNKYTVFTVCSQNFCQSGCFSDFQLNKDCSASNDGLGYTLNVCN
jgi:hypothetical protein